MRSRSEEIAQSAEFRALIRSKAAFLIPSVCFFVTYYFALPLLITFAPDLMKQQAIGPLNWAYVFALSQFFMAWILAWVYVKKAASFDEQAHQILVKRGLAK